MIEEEGLFVHLDPAGDRIADQDFEFTGWVAAKQPVIAVWLPAVSPVRLTSCDRPDVRRVFPDRVAFGFSGTCAGVAIGPSGLRVAIELHDRVVELDHPVPDPLPRPFFFQRGVSAVRVAWLRWRERLASDSSARFHCLLQRHLIARQLRGGLFERRHTDALLEDFATALPDAFFLQIGANDGFTGDPLYPIISRDNTRWRGVMVEPVAHLFEQLSERHGKSPSLRLEHAAIGEHDGAVVVHRPTIAPTDSLWLEQVPSLDREVALHSAEQLGKGSNALVQEEVPCLTIGTLLQRHAITELDLLVIDAEGWDWRILRQFDLDALQPKLILYEHQHLGAEERNQAHQCLARFGYDWAETKEGDTLGWRLA